MTTGQNQMPDNGARSTIMQQVQQRIEILLLTATATKFPQLTSDRNIYELRVVEKQFSSWFPNKFRKIRW